MSGWGELFSYVDLEERVPKNHPLRLIRRIVNEVPAALDRQFAELYAAEGRPSIAPDGCCDKPASPRDCVGPEDQRKSTCRPASWLYTLATCGQREMWTADPGSRSMMEQVDGLAAEQEDEQS
jgi:hypothetical protein